MPNRPTFRFCRIQVFEAYKHPKRAKRKEGRMEKVMIYLLNDELGDAVEGSYF